MSILDRMQSRIPAKPFTFSGIKTAQLLLLGVMLAAVFTRFWRLDQPDQCYFDEIYFSTTGAEILRGDTNAWDFYGHENTHPPLSKELIALGEGIWGQQSRTSGNQCWGDQANAARRTDPNWTYKPIGWRFFGALAGVGSVFFMYLLAKRLFQSEVAGLAAAALLTFDGLALAQSRIGTPDTFVLFFVLGTVYFLVSDRFLLAGAFFGASAASKWIGAFTMVPIVLYLIVRLLKGLQQTRSEAETPEATLDGDLDMLLITAAVAATLAAILTAAASIWFALIPLVPAVSFAVVRAAEGLQKAGEAERLRQMERILRAGGATAGVAAVVAAIGAFAGDGFSAGARTAAAPFLIAVLIVLVGLIGIAVNSALRRSPRGRLYLEMALVFPIFFIIVPGYVYLMTYVPMLLNGHDLGDVWTLNKQAYDFHSHLNAPHAYSSTWRTWPIMMRPLYLYVSSTGDGKIYSLGNPVIFWLGMPALAFTLWQGLNLRTMMRSESGRVTVGGALRLSQWPLLFVVLGYLGVWLPWATQPRILFIYHYLPALSFVILALAYCVHRLWYHEQQWGRTAAIGLLVLAGLTFVYFYPHLTALDVSHSLDESYYWFPSWR